MCKQSKYLLYTAHMVCACMQRCMHIHQTEKKSHNVHTLLLSLSTASAHVMQYLHSKLSPGFLGVVGRLSTCRWYFTLALTSCTTEGCMYVHSTLLIRGGGLVLEGGSIGRRIYIFCHQSGLYFRWILQVKVKRSFLRIVHVDCVLYLSCPLCCSL